MKKILSILAFVLVAISSNAQVYSNVPAGPIMPVATPFSAYWVNTATDAASGLSLLGGGTNSGGGTTNFLLSGVVTGQTTNNSFSTSGSNVIANIAQQYAGGSNSINNLNGFGTNTTLKSAISISTTNLSAKGTTWLNNSNMTISLSGISISGGGLIPLMTDSNAPSGLATASSSFGGSLPWKAFSTGVTWQSGNETASWLQYQFPSAVTVYSNLLYIQDASIDTNSFYSVAYSQDGSSWTQSFQTNRNPGTGYLPYSIVFPNPFTAKYVRWYFTNNVGYAFSYLVISNQLYGYSSAINLMSNSYALSIVSSNGVAINTNSAGTNALEVFGNVDSTVGFTVNGQPIGSAASSPIGIYSQLYVTNATGTATNFNGIYTSAGSYFTNNTTGWFIVAPATWYPDANTIPRGSYNAYGLVTNLIYGSITPAFSNSTLIGTYSGNPTNIFPTVTPYYGQTSGTTYTNFSGTIGAGGILGSGIDTNLSPAQLAAAGVVTTSNLSSAYIPSGVADWWIADRLALTNGTAVTNWTGINGNNLIGNGATMALQGIGGRPSLNFGGSGVLTNGSVVPRSSSNSLTMFFVYRQVRPVASPSQQIAFSLQADTSYPPALGFQPFRTDSGYVYGHSMMMFAYAYSFYHLPLYKPNFNNVVVYSFAYDTNGFRDYVNGRLTTLAPTLPSVNGWGATGVGGYGVLSIGGDFGKVIPWSGMVAEVGVVTNALTNEQMDAVNAGLLAKYGVIQPTIVLAGDSMVWGGGATYGSSLIDLVGGSFRDYNINVTAYPGRTSGQNLTEQPYWVASQSPSSGRKVAVLWTDMVNDGVFTTLTNNIATWCNTSRSNGWLVAFVVPPSSTNADIINTGANNRTNLIAWAQSSWTNYADGLIDLSRDPKVGPYNAQTNLSYYVPGGIHFTNAAYASVTPGFFVPVIKNLLYGSFDCTQTSTPPPTVNQPWHCIDPLAPGAYFVNSNGVWIQK